MALVCWIQRPDGISWKQHGKVFKEDAWDGTFYYRVLL